MKESNKQLKWVIKDSSRVFWTVVAKMTEDTEYDYSPTHEISSVKESEKHYWWEYEVSSENECQLKGYILGQYDENISLQYILTDVSMRMTSLFLASGEARKLINKV